MDEYPVVQIPADEILEEEEFERLYVAPVEIIIVLSIFYGSISIFAVIGNVLVIWVVVTTRQMRTVTNTYIANLAVADVVIGLFCIPFQFQAALLQRWNLPWFMCGFCPFVQTLSVNVSVFTLIAIAIDRHRAIINPLRARPSKYISKFIIFGIWLLALVFATPSAIAFRVELVEERYREDGVIVNVTRPFCMNVNLSDEQLKAYRYVLVVVQYFVPFCVIAFVYVQMAFKLWFTQTPGNAEDTRDMALMRNKKKVIKMLIVVVIVFGICWLPLQIYNILYVTIPEINEYHFIGMIWFCCDWLAMSNSCYNPFIYGIYNEKFKREFNKRFSACFCKFHTNHGAHERTLSIHTRATSLRSNFANSSVRIRNNLFAEAAGINGSNIYYTCRYANMRKGRNARNSAFDRITYSIQNGETVQFNECNRGHITTNSGVSVGDEHQCVPQWRRNNFKPLHPDVIECDDDALMHSKSISEESNSSVGGGNVVDVSGVVGFALNAKGKR
ncbi:RYamide receptor [Anastrepha obliqua]|uniref:RYamide receptor n=1 Tax=Anastrepha obliqua TaxID=95512 RepID=UPI00240A805D|nr:RYamide receptor [Anastrepha obliqua]